MKFGEKVRRLRKKSAMTQAELAQRSSLSKRTIINYESGASYPKKREVYRTLADIFEVELNYLLTEDDEFIMAGNEKYGLRGMRQAERLVDDLSSLFAGGELSDEDLDGVMRAIQESYWIAKEKAKKYTPKKYLRDAESPGDSDTQL
ncbi:MAG: helix-turn-helix transcriptional regulator [Eubacteriales bacterium]|jgi:transcriptional regulator with XRE-family HTH domain|nr:helix-turn-helix transcriptional regulator [Eubacteriales bacterium]